jgi:hypothetical protein
MKDEGTPRTRQSLLTLAAFRPWGGSQDGRHAGSTAQSKGYPSPAHGRPDEAPSTCRFGSQVGCPARLGRLDSWRAEWKATYLAEPASVAVSDPAARAVSAS